MIREAGLPLGRLGLESFGCRFKSAAKVLKYNSLGLACWRAYDLFWNWEFCCLGNYFPFFCWKKILWNPFHSFAEQQCGLLMGPCFQVRQTWVGIPALLLRAWPIRLKSQSLPLKNGHHCLDFRGLKRTVNKLVTVRGRYPALVS